MATLLLFNIQDQEKRTAVRLLSLRSGFAVRDIRPEEQNLKISELLSGAKPTEPNRCPFLDEMMIMSGFSSQDMHALVDGMRENGCPVRLKCVVTETNKSWTAVRLHKALAAEDQAMRKRQAKR